MSQGLASLSFGRVAIVVIVSLLGLAAADGYSLTLVNSMGACILHYQVQNIESGGGGTRDGAVCVRATS